MSLLSLPALLLSKAAGLIAVALLLMGAAFALLAKSLEPQAWK